MATETKKAESPPYIAFGTFLSFIKGLQKTGVPSRIDKSLLRNMSGGNQSALLAALKWFGLIDDVGTHGPLLEVLVGSGDKVGEAMRDMLPGAYAFMADGSIQLDKATGSQVEEKFKAYGLTGSTVVKAMAFFISACKEAGIPLSAHIKLPKVLRTNGAGKAKKARAQEAAASAEDEGEEEEGAKGRKRSTSTESALMEKFPAFDPSWPANIQEKWFDGFAKLQEMVKDK